MREEIAQVTRALSLKNKIKGNLNVESSQAFDIRVKRPTRLND